MTGIMESSHTSNRRFGKPRNILPDAVVNSIIKAYIAGESENSLAKRHGVSRQVIRQRLLSHGVTRRSQSEAETVKWLTIKATPGGTERQLSAAWGAVREKARPLRERILNEYRDVFKGGKSRVAQTVGCSRSNVSRIIREEQPLRHVKLRRAVARELSGKSGTSPYEVELLDAMQASGLHPCYQMRVATCNVDFAFPEVRVAVELERRYIRDSKSIRPKRLKDIFDRGWRVLVVEDPRKQGIDYAAVCKQVIAFLDLVRGQPAATGQYGVIGRDGKTVSRASSYLDGFTRIAGF